MHPCWGSITNPVCQHNFTADQQLKVKELGHELYTSHCTSPSGIPFPRQAENFHASSAQEGANMAIKIA